MTRWRTYLPTLAISAQALINIPFYGIPAILLMTALPGSLSTRCPWILPLLILAYFSLAIIYLYHAGVSFDPKKAKLAGYPYFLTGLGLSLVSLYSFLVFGDYETLLLPWFISLWGLLSLMGLMGLVIKVEKLNGPVSLVVSFFVALSAVISASTAEL